MFSVQHHDSTPVASVNNIIGRANEDRYTLATLNESIQMYAIYDGHGGKEAADYLKQNMPKKFANTLVGTDFTNEKMIREIIEDEGIW